MEQIVEHFGFVPIDIIDDVINAVNSILHTAMIGISTFLHETNPDYDWDNV